MVIDKEDSSNKIMLNNNEITIAEEEKLLGILLSSKLNFEDHKFSLQKGRS